MNNRTQNHNHGDSVLLESSQRAANGNSTKPQSNRNRKESQGGWDRRALKKLPARPVEREVGSPSEKSPGLVDRLMEPL